MNISDINWSLIISILASLGLVGVLLLALQRQNFALAAQLLEQANNNPALKDAIEAAGKNVSPEVVSLITGLISTGEPLVGGNADVIKALEELKKLIIAVTDGLPNLTTPPSQTTVNASAAPAPRPTLPLDQQADAG